MAADLVCSQWSVVQVATHPGADGPSMSRMISTLKKFLPHPIRRRMKKYLTNRRKESLFGILAPLVPDVEAMFDGPPTLEEFKANGEEFLKIYREIAHLRPDEKMLDVGCGIGRKTLPLT